MIASATAASIESGSSRAVYSPTQNVLVGAAERRPASSEMNWRWLYSSGLNARNDLTESNTRMPGRTSRSSSMTRSITPCSPPLASGSRRLS